MRLDDEARWQAAPWLLLAALALHNLEEGLTFAQFLPRLGASAPAALREVLPDPPTLRAGLEIVTVAALAAVAVTATPRLRAARDTVTATLAAVLLLNVAVPHVPAALLLGGYVPGLVTAVSVNLLLATTVLHQLRRSGRVRRRDVTAIAAVAMVVVVVGPTLLFALLAACCTTTAGS